MEQLEPDQFQVIVKHPTKRDHYLIVSGPLEALPAMFQPLQRSLDNAWALHWAAAEAVQELDALLASGREVDREGFAR